MHTIINHVYNIKIIWTFFVDLMAITLNYNLLNTKCHVTQGTCFKNDDVNMTWVLGVKNNGSLILSICKYSDCIFIAKIWLSNIFECKGSRLACCLWWYVHLVLLTTESRRQIIAGEFRATATQLYLRSAQGSRQVSSVMCFTSQSAHEDTIDRLGYWTRYLECPAPISLLILKWILNF